MQKIVSIDGMMCNHCAGAVEKALTALEGVSSVTVNLEAKQAAVTCVDAVTEDCLRDAVTKAGYTVVSIK